MTTYPIKTQIINGQEFKGSIRENSGAIERLFKHFADTKPNKDTAPDKIISEDERVAFMKRFDTNADGSIDISEAHSAIKTIEEYNNNTSGPIKHHSFEDNNNLYEYEHTSERGKYNQNLINYAWRDLSDRQNNSIHRATQAATGAEQPTISDRIDALKMMPTINKRQLLSF